MRTCESRLIKEKKIFSEDIELVESRYFGERIQLEEFIFHGCSARGAKVCYRVERLEKEKEIK
jgi:hypothetical protein